jgi:hypothetical protein
VSNGVANIESTCRTRLLFEPRWKRRTNGRGRQQEAPCIKSIVAIALGSSFN